MVIIPYLFGFFPPFENGGNSILYGFFSPFENVGYSILIPLLTMTSKKNYSSVSKCFNYFVTKQ